MKQHIIIWGLGKTGTAFIDYFSLYKPNQTIIIFIDSNKKIIEQYKDFFNDNHHFIFDFQENIEQYIHNNTIIIPSPGIKIPEQYLPYIKAELDYFFDHLYYDDYICAVTGSSGKTSTTTLLHAVLEQLLKQRLFLGGNIGNPLFNYFNVLEKINNGLDRNLKFNKKKSIKESIILFLERLTTGRLCCYFNNKFKTPSNKFILEVSNLQLQHTKSFAPNIALIVNFYENHLINHDSFYDYVYSKCKIYLHDIDKTYVFLNNQAYKIIKDLGISLPKKYLLYGINKTEEATVNQIYIKNNWIVFYDQNKEFDLIPIKDIPDISFIENWIGIIAILHHLKLDIHELKNINNLTIPDHRLEYCGMYKNIMVFNDSKSTIMESTFYAIENLKLKYPEKKITCILGGLSKGVDRISKLKNYNFIDTFIFFGKEADDLSKGLKDSEKNIFKTCMLDQALQLAFEKTDPNSIILFSPGGSSYDLFKDYQDRGNQFKKIIQTYK